MADIGAHQEQAVVLVGDVDHAGVLQPVDRERTGVEQVPGRATIGGRRRRERGVDLRDHLVRVVVAGTDVVEDEALLP